MADKIDFRFLSALKSMNTNPPTSLSGHASLNGQAANKINSASATSKVGNSLSQALTKVPNNSKPAATFSERLTETLKHGVNYFTKVRDQAIEDKEKGIKGLAGGEKLWQSLLVEAEKFSAKGQNAILENFAKESGNLIADQVKGTTVGSILEEILPSGAAASKGAGVLATTGTAASTVATGVGTTAATTTGAATAATGTGSSILGSLGGSSSALTQGVGAAFSLYKLIDGFGKTTPVEGAMHGATVGAYVGTMVAPGIGTVIGGLIGGVGGAIMGLFSKKKHPDRVQRDQMRNVLSQIGFTDKDNQVALADGSKFSIGIDGKKTLPNTDGTTRYGYQLDYSNPLVNKAIALAQPLAEIFTGGAEKLKVDFIGYLVNAATSNAKSKEDVAANIKAMYVNSGIAPEKMLEGLAQLTKESKIKEDELKVYVNDMTELFSSSDASSNKNPAKPEMKIAA